MSKDVLHRGFLLLKQAEHMGCFHRAFLKHCSKQGMVASSIGLLIGERHSFADGFHGGQHLWRLIRIQGIQGSLKCCDQVPGARLGRQGHHCGADASR